MGLGLAAPLSTRAASGHLAAEAMAAPAPARQACPAEMPAGTLCFSGHDGVGSAYRVALPPGWRHDVLVLHAHGEPEDAHSREDRALADLKRWAVAVKAGYAWAGTSYRESGWGMTRNAQDVERMRQIFVRFFGATRVTLLHGQGYGAGVAAKAAELFAPTDGQHGPYDGVILTNGFLAGGVRGYEFRLDLRTVYQFFCRNHPRPDEPQYPLWMGLPKESSLTREELAARIDECTGIGKPRAQRSVQQQANLAAIVEVARIRASWLVTHMARATWLMRDITQDFLGGRNPWTNVGAAYEGSEQDRLLNAGVQRYAADPRAAAQLDADSTPTGSVNVPVLTMHAIDDPVAFVEFESAYRATLERAGTDGRLVQAFSDEASHSRPGDTEFVALVQAMLEWIDHGNKPSPLAVAQRCIGLQQRYGASCRFAPNYFPAPLETRVAPRER
jgi:hypothetical protein